MPAPTIPATLKGSVVAGRIPKFVSNENGLTSIAYWGGLLQVMDAMGAVKSQQQMDQDITAQGWLGRKLIVALADGWVVALAEAG